MGFSKPNYKKRDKVALALENSATLHKSGIMGLLDKVVAKKEATENKVTLHKAIAFYKALLDTIHEQLEKEGTVVLEGLVKIEVRERALDLKMNNKGVLKTRKSCKVTVTPLKELAERFTQIKVVEEDILNKLEESGMTPKNREVNKKRATFE